MSTGPDDTDEETRRADRANGEPQATDEQQSSPATRRSTEGRPEEQEGERSARP
jgi:hypothetical protein